MVSLIFCLLLCAIAHGEMEKTKSRSRRQLPYSVIQPALVPMPQNMMMQQPQMGHLPQNVLGQHQPAMGYMPQNTMMQQPAMGHLPQNVLGQHQPAMGYMPQNMMMQQPEMGYVPQNTMMQQPAMGHLPQNAMMQQQPAQRPMPQYVLGLQQPAMRYMPQNTMMQKPAMGPMPQNVMIQQQPTMEPVSKNAMVHPLMGAYFMGQGRFSPLMHPIPQRMICPANRDCLFPPDVKDCGQSVARWFWNPLSQQCERFFFGGCSTNSNNFATESDCLQNCAKKCEPCELPADKGPCDGNVVRWYYDLKTKNCIQFVWGGCGGNSNNFESRDACLQTCSARVGTAVCNMGIDRGPCSGHLIRWAYNPTYGRCIMFVWGGCLGNENNFDSQQECEGACGQGGSQ